MLCSHEFVWPDRAADGGYRQCCVLCGAEYKYDWENMRRLERVYGEPELKAAPKLTAPGLTLLVELEPRRVVFVRNLAEILAGRSAPPLPAGSTAPFWPDVFIESRIPWWWFLESLLCHVIMVAFVVILSQVWTQPEPSQRRIFDRSYISYYQPSDTFPALRSSPPRPHPVPANGKSKGKPGSGHQSPLQVATERRPGSITAPDIKLTAPARPNIVAASPALPAIPFSAIGRSQLTVPAGPNSVVAPPPDVNQTMARRLGLPQASQASIVAPPADVKGISWRPGLGSSGLDSLRPAAVAPAPALQAATRGMGDLTIGHSEVVGPAPRLPMSEQHAGSGMARAILGFPGTSVVPPAPTVQRAGTLIDGSGAGNNGRGNSLSGAASQVVPPPPSVQGAGDSAGTGRGSSFSSAGMQVVPPPPSTQGAGSSAGAGRAGSLSAGGLQAVPPAPSMQGTGRSGGGGQSISASGTGLQGIPPAPGAGGQGSGGNSGDGTQTSAMEDRAGASSPTSETDNAHEPATEELPIRLVGLALALPSSSYFSNYEVFIAEKAMNKVKSQLIKLVYVSLPYQRRLSEYGLDTSKVLRLHVRRDSTCDESLLQMTWPENDPHPDSQHPADSPGLSGKDRSDLLPCYRTTADDNRKELSRAR